MKKVLLEMEKMKNLNSGLGQFCSSIGEQFQKINPQNLELNYYLPALQKNIFGDQANYIKQLSFHKLIPLSSTKYDIWHCLQQDSHYLPTSNSTKLILTIHDLNFLEKYKGAKQKSKLNKLQKKVDKASAITVISKFTEMIVRENLNTNDTPVHVIYNGNSLKLVENASKPDFVNFQEYIFSIGIISAKKNFHSLFPLLQNNKNLTLVIAGNSDTDYAKQLIKTAKEIGVYDRLKLVGTINDEQKYWLYKNCNAFVFPSLSEGFGLPVVEAMSLGKPVFLSNLTSLPEIGGPEAYYWKNFESKEMIDVFEKGMIDFNSDVNKKNRSIEWSKQFSWENAAKAYIKLYNEI